MRFASMVWLLWLIPTLGANATTYLLQPDGSGDFETIQQAIWAASNGDVIELADGVFVGDGNRRVDFEGKAVILRSASGDPSRCAVDIQATVDKQEFGFEFSHGEGPGTRMEHLTILNGLDLGGC